MSPATNRPPFAPWDERVPPRIISNDESARRIRTFAAIEERLAAMLDRFAGVIDEPHAQATLARHARQHEWHAGIFRDALVDSDGTSGIEDDELAEFMAAVEEPADAGSAIEFLAGVYRVLIPRQITAYTYFVRALGGDASDADARWFEFIFKDDFDGIRDGELLLQSMLSATGAVDRAARRRAELEARMVALGGLAGPDTLGPTGDTTAKEAATR